MTTAPDGNYNGWTFDTIKNLVDEREARTAERFISMKVAVDAALAASDRAVTKAELATEKRFEGVNEFRSALSDQAATMLPRVEFDVQHKALIEKMTLCDNRLSEMQIQITSNTSAVGGRREGFGTIGSIVMGVIAGFASLIAVGTLIVHIIK